MNTSRLLLAIAALFIGISAMAQDIVYVNASAFPVYGKISEETDGRYERLPAYLKGVSRKAIWTRGRHSTGLYIRFRSNSTTIHVKWESLFNNTYNHMADIGTKGLDLYALVDGKWRFIGPGRPSADGISTHTIVKNMTPIEREFMLYLSLYDGIKSLEIGVDEGSYIDQPAVDSPSQEKPIVMYGSSILQGGCAIRPGMAFSNIIARMTDRTVCNLGFSGNALLDMDIAHLMASVKDPGLFVLDYVPNAKAERIKEAGEEFFRIIRKAHPDVPVIFVEDSYVPRTEFNTKNYEDIYSRNKEQKALFKKLKKAGEKNIYYVPAEGMIGSDGEATVDSRHFTDLGNVRYVEHIMPIIRKALR
jgi:hypothetical protein